MGLVLHVAQANRLATTENCLIISRNNLQAVQSSWKIQSDARLRLEQSVCEYVNQLPEKEFKQIELESSLYFDELNKYQLHDKTLAGYFSASGWKGFTRKVTYILYLAGMLLNAFPVYVARRIADKKVYRNDFYSWIFVSCYSLLYFTWIITLLLISIFLGWPYLIALLVLMIPSGIFAFYYTGWLRSADQQKKLSALQLETLSRLKMLRSRIAARL
jgi:hypothetical protein